MIEHKLICYRNFNGFKIIYTTSIEITPNNWYRIILRFYKFRYNVSIQLEDPIAPENMNYKLRDTELNYKSHQFYDVGLKDGRFGF